MLTSNGLDPALLLAQKINEAKHITVFTGAGISTSSNIPDFRSPGGVYDQVKARYDLPFPEAIFDLEYFDEDPEPFFDFSQNLMGIDIEPSSTHAFLAYLELEGKLQILVTQNIDGLHEKAGNKKVLACHGSYQRGHCRNCGQGYSLIQMKSHLSQGSVMLCHCSGVVKPDVVFFGENLPLEFYALADHPPTTDLLLVLGTGLEIHPAASFPLKVIQQQNPESWIINLTPTSHDGHFSHRVQEDLDTFFTKVQHHMTRTLGFTL